MDSKKAILRIFISSVLTLGALFPFSAQALQITGTRVIYDEGRPEVTVQITNPSQLPVLAQTWIDDSLKTKNTEVANKKNETTNNKMPVPFIITPALFRIEPGKAQTLRVLYYDKASNLPKDKESVLLLNVLELPPKTSNDLAGKNILKMAIQTQVKLFYRPSHLKGSVEDAPSQLIWRFAQNPNGLPSLEVSNPTAYHVTLGYAQVQANNQIARTTSRMVNPGETITLPLNKAMNVGPDTKVQYGYINDFGTMQTGDSKLQISPTA